MTAAPNAAPAAERPSLASSLRDPRRLLAIGLLAVAGGLVLAFVAARGNLAGSDAYAYWQGVHRWWTGIDIYQMPLGRNLPPPAILPYPYAPWTLYLLIPWALIPWDVAWVLWRGAMFVTFAVSVGWAYRQRPLGTAVLVALLGPSLAANFDTGNVNIFIVLGMWLAWWSGPRLGGLLWALGSGIKIIPVVLLWVVPRRAWRWGIGILAVLVVLSLATWPQTLRQLDVVLFYPRPLRADYLVFLWGAVPWLYSRPWPPRLSRAWFAAGRAG